MLIRHPRKRKTGREKKKGKWLNMLESFQSTLPKKKHSLNSEASLSSAVAYWVCFLSKEKLQA